MNTSLHINEQQLQLGSFLSKARNIVTLGRQSEEAYNVIAVEDAPGIDVFQCQFTPSPQGWKVQNGQWRTDCPKGILSRLQHACSMCMGRCVNTHPARPTYGWRLPQSPTLLNGKPLTTEAVLLKDGDTLQADRLQMHVSISE